MEKSNKNEEPKILVSKVQHILEWIKTKIYLDTNSDKTKNRIVRRGEVYKCNFGIGIGSEMQKEKPCVIIQSDVGNKIQAILELCHETDPRLSTPINIEELQQRWEVFKI